VPATSLDWTETIEDTFAEISTAFEKLSWRLLEGTLAIVMSLFAWAAISWPGPVSSSYRVVIATTILVATGIVEYFVIRLERHPLVCAGFGERQKDFPQ